MDNKTIAEAYAERYGKINIGSIETAEYSKEKKALIIKFSKIPTLADDVLANAPTEIKREMGLGLEGQVAFTFKEYLQCIFQGEEIEKDHIENSYMMRTSDGILFATVELEGKKEVKITARERYLCGNNMKDLLKGYALALK